eukprot:scaffold2351_cov403-Prasinococcus_capsulatus_cf.AAC.16
MGAKKLINKPHAVVTEMLQGLVAQNSALALLEGNSPLKVVVDTTFNKEEQVAVVSGGGSGHEPAFAGYVGAGMLAAAVCGEVFTSPTVHAVLSAIRAVTGPKGELHLAFISTSRVRLLADHHELHWRPAKLWSCRREGTGSGLQGANPGGRRGLRNTATPRHRRAARPLRRHPGAEDCGGGRSGWALPGGGRRFELTETWTWTKTLAAG